MSIRVELYALDRLALRDVAGHDLSAVLAQPKRLALLLYLALASHAGSSPPAGLFRRDSLLALFWPELDQRHARGALRKALQFLRQSLGSDALIARGEEEVGLGHDAVWCDAVAFLRALEERRPVEALTLYQGDLAPGLFVAGAPAVEEWIEAERIRLRRKAARAARELRDQCEAAGRLTIAVDWGRRAAALAGDDERAWRELIALLDRLGDRSGALRVYETLVTRLAVEYEVEPSPETKQLVAEVRARVARETAAPGPPRDGTPAIGTVFADRYRLEAEVSRQGAMARVFVARDLRHDRKVAVKVLTAELAQGEGRERFLREIGITARLTHPHILTLFDSGESAGLLYFVMPFIEGETLRDRLDREGELPVNAAIGIATQVAAALDHAHAAGIVHRDVKPENILLHSGEVLVADFGIAHAVRVAAEDPAPKGVRLTAAGIALGTPAYMSPEQAAGARDPDARSDVYSMAAVLYELLTGEPPHTGSDRQMVLARVLTEPVRSVRAARPAVPAGVDAAIQKALSKRPADRYDSAAAFARAIVERDSKATATPAARPPDPAAKRAGRRVRAFGASMAGLSLLAVVLLAARAWSRGSSPIEVEGRAVRRWEVALPDSAPLAFVGASPFAAGQSSLAISPDGSRLVYVARRGPTTQLYLRSLDRLGAASLPGTEGAYQPFFSPDGRWIGFFAGRELKKVAIAGGPATTLSLVREPLGGAWARDGRILVADFQGYRASWVPDGGGTAEPVERWPGLRLVHPSLVSGEETAGDWVLSGSNSGLLYLGSLTSGELFVLTRDGAVPTTSVDLGKTLFGSNPRYLRSGHIAWFAGGVLMVVPFDLARRRVLGPPEPVLEGVRLEAWEGGSQLTVSEGGTLVYAPGENARLSRLVWVDHVTGRLDTVPFPSAEYGPFALAPDGKRVIARIVPSSGPAELWVLNTERGERARVHVEGIAASGRWWPDGNSVVFGEYAANGSTPSTVTVRQSLSGSTRRDTLARGRLHFDISRVSSLLAVSAFPAPGITVVSLDGARDSLHILTGPAAFPTFAPDGRSIAYTDWAPEKSEVKLVRIASPEMQRTVSVDGGEEALWTPDGKGLVYRKGWQWLQVDVATGGDLRVGTPRALFEGRYQQVPGLSHDLSPDGRRHLVLVGPAQETSDRLVVVTGWFRELGSLRASRK